MRHAFRITMTFDASSSGWHNARSILAVRLDNAGDVIMLGPALRAIRGCLPEARLDLLASRAGAAAAALLPWVDDVIEWRPIWQDIGEVRFDPSKEMQLVERLRERSYGAALIFTSFSQNSHVPGYVCGLAGIPLRAGQSAEFAGATLTTQVGKLPEDLHQVERNLILVRTVGYHVEDSSLDVRIPFQTQDLLLPGLSEHAEFVVIHPGASAEARRYSPERFGEVARLLAETGRRVVFTGTVRERDDLDRAVSSARGATGSNHIQIAPLDLTIEQYAAILDRSQLVICNNTLPMHLADAVNTPAVVLYSGTDRESQWRPRSIPHRLLRRETSCYPCYKFQCSIRKPCLDISPEEVAAAAMELLDAG